MRHIRSTVSPARPGSPFQPAGNCLRGQAGFTLIEMVIVVVILGMLTVAVNQVIAHAVRVSSHGTDSMTAIKQVESAFHWVTIDVQQARTITTGPDSGFPLVLTWAEWDGTEHAVTYSIDGNEMKRSVSIGGGAPEGMVVARYINPDSASTNCSLNGNTLILTLTAFGGDRSPYSETRQGMVFSRF